MDRTMSADIEQLWQEYHRPIAQYVRRRVSQEDMREEIVQTVFVKAWEAMCKGMGAVESVSGWLFRIAHNLIIDHYRFRDRHQQVSIDEIPHAIDKDGDPVKAAERTIDKELVESILCKVGGDNAEVLRLRFLEGHTFDEIGEMLGKSKEAVKSSRHRGLKRANRIVTDKDYAVRPKVYRQIANSRKRAIVDVLQANGPMTMREIIRATHSTKGSVNAALYRNSRLFAKVGYQARPRGRVALWGLVGIHDKEAA